MNRSRLLLYFLELALLSFVFFADYYFLTHFHDVYSLNFFRSWKAIPEPRDFPLYVKAFWAALAAWAIVLWVKNSYSQFRIQTNPMILYNSLFEGVVFAGFYTSLAFLLKLEFLSRFFILFYTASSVTALAADRILVLSIARYARKKGINTRHILIIGTGPRAQQLISRIAKHPEWGYRVTGLVDPDPMLIGEDVAAYRVIGALEDLPRILEENVVDEVFFVVPRKWLDKIQGCILYCEALGVPATISTDLFDLEIAKHRTYKDLDGMAYLSFQTRVLKGGELLVKRIGDILFAAAVLTLISPVLLAVAVAIKITSKGPVFFKQVRSGLHGRKFKIYKFRSMIVDAEKQLAALKQFNQMSGPVFKMDEDPRITPVGRFLRKTSLDEFPQFLNVLNGDMSVVGPRPPLPNEVEEYEPWQRRRLSMKPGITCIWQVSGRNAIDFEKWMELDLKYIDNWSLGLDCLIIAKTVQTVLISNGK